MDHQRDIVKYEIYNQSLFNINYRRLQTIILGARFTFISSVSHRTSQRTQHVLIIKTNDCDISSYPQVLDLQIFLQPHIEPHREHRISQLQKTNDCDIYSYLHVKLVSSGFNQNPKYEI